MPEERRIAWGIDPAMNDEDRVQDSLTYRFFDTEPDIDPLSVPVPDDRIRDRFRLGDTARAQRRAFEDMLGTAFSRTLTSIIARALVRAAEDNQEPFRSCDWPETSRYVYSRSAMLDYRAWHDCAACRECQEWYTRFLELNFPVVYRSGRFLSEPEPEPAPIPERFRYANCEQCGDMYNAQDGHECVQCEHCNAWHTEPVCHGVVPDEATLIFCGRCNGMHAWPDCGDRPVCSRRNGYMCRYCDQLVSALNVRRRRNGPLDDYDDDRGGYSLLNRRATTVFNYSFLPNPLVFRGEGPLYLGMELETEVNDLRANVSDAAEIANEHLGEIGYLKEDGSIDYGFEIVTTPMSYPYFLEHFPFDMLTKLQEIGCRTTRGTGIHVHVSKAAFTPVHAYKWLKFWHRNREQVEAFARRDSAQWAQFSRDDRRRVKFYCKGQYNRNDEGRTYGPPRYSAINVLPPYTYEVRVFRSSLSPRRVRATLGLVAASVAYTRELTPAAISAGGWDWAALTKWVRRQSGTYPDLFRELSATSSAPSR